MKFRNVFGVLFLFFCGAHSQCLYPERLTFVRWVGASPAKHIPVFLYEATQNEASLPGVCLSRCRELEECAAVIVAYEKGLCTGVARGEFTDLVSDSDVSYFEKVCLDLPDQCHARWWVAEAIPGYQLNSERQNVKMHYNVTMKECYSDLVSSNDTQTVRRSAQWIRDSSPELDHVLVSRETLGSCLLNQEDRVTEPEAYRVASYNTIYLEDQCRHDYHKKIDRCSYEEYYNQTLKHVDFSIGDITRDQCRTQCESEDRFVCRGFSWRSNTGGGDNTLGLCDLHSEELVASGSWLLRRTTNSTFHRRVVCLNLTIECNATHLMVTYQPRITFRGRMYTAGDEEACGVRGTGGAATLVLPLNGTCDVNFAHAITSVPGGVINRTMAYAIVVVQNNPLLQTAGDRWLRAGCAPPPPRHLNTSVAVLNEQSPSAVYNSAGLVTVTVRPVDGPLGSVTLLGQLMELIVETTDANEVEVYRLVASSRLGERSVLLLDGRGCPAGQVDFPTFTRTWTPGGAQRLTARFKAFRFPYSNVVRFTMMIRRCGEKCPVIDCAQPMFRSARTSNFTITDSEPVPEYALSENEILYNSTFETKDPNTKYEKSADIRMPLEVEIVVGSNDVISEDNLIHAEHQSNELVESADNSLVCVHELVVVCLSLAWLAVQLILLLACCVVLKRYRNLAELSMQKDYHSFDNAGFDTISTHRRVHWPDQNVDILHTH